jgi:alpha-tubulin suppressor-like RCC1 family protein
VVLENGRVHYFGNSEIWNLCHFNKEQSGSFTIRGHKIHSIALGFDHNIMVTIRGAVFGFGSNVNHQLGVVDPSALLGDRVSTSTEVFFAITKFKGAARLVDGKELQQPGGHQP